jgi:hypothetical protein
MYFLADIYTYGVQNGDRTGLCNILTSHKNDDILIQLDQVSNYARRMNVNYFQYDAVTLSNVNIDF